MSLTAEEIAKVDGRKEYLNKLKNRKPGVTSRNTRGTKALDVVPYDETNIHKSKSQFREDRKIAKMVKVRVADASKRILKEAQEEVAKETALEKKKAIDEVAGDQGAQEGSPEPGEATGPAPEAIEPTPDADGVDLNEKTVAELKKLAADEDVDLGEATKKADIIAKIMAAD